MSEYPAEITVNGETVFLENVTLEEALQIIDFATNLLQSKLDKLLKPNLINVAIR